MLKSLVPLLLLLGPCVHAQGEARSPQKPVYTIEIEPDRVRVTIDGRVAQTLPLRQNGVQAADIVRDDYNFDGYMDLSLPGDSGRQKYRIVHLYDPNARRLVPSEALSALPCLALDRTHKRVQGLCFHEGCEHWSASYQILDFDTLQITGAHGNICDPGSGKAYRYEEIYRSGKLHERTLKELEQ